MPKDPLSKISFVDVETTGTSATSDRIIDIGIIRVEAGKIISEFETLVNPQTHLSPYISQMTSITPEMLYRAPIFEEIKSKVYTLLDETTFIAHNAQFDYAFIKNEFARLETKFNAKMLCTVRLSRLLFPHEHHHNLDAIINRFRIQVEARHRAFPDAKALYFFMEKAKLASSEEAFEKAIQYITKSPRVPSAISKDLVKNIPDLPGVYIFYDKDGTVLYVGKSVHLKDRVMNHFSSFHSNSTDLKLSSSIADIEVKVCGGDLSASLLEAELIKKLQPAFNKKLREICEVVAVIKKDDRKYHSIEIKRLTLPLNGEHEKILCVYPSMRKAKEELYEICKVKRLCPRILGLEKGKGRCFYSQIELCDGACTGEEPAIKHNIKLIEAFKEYFIPKWPFAGEILVKEESSEVSELTHINNWVHIGSTRKNGDGSEIYQEKEKGIYTDTVKILKRFLRRKEYLSKIRLASRQFNSNTSIVIPT